MILSGILLTPTGEPYKNASVRITANNTSPDVLMFVQKDFKTDVDGEYEIDVPNGWYHVSVFSLAYRSYVNIGNIEVTDATTETTINQLLMLDQTAHSDGLAAQVAADAASALASKNAASASATQSAVSATTATNSAIASANSATASQTSSTNSLNSSNASQVSAEMSATKASDSAASAAASQVSADLATGSLGTVNIYVDTTTGLAATTATTNKYFSVPSTDSNEYLILYKNVSGSAVEQKRYPSANLFGSTADNSFLLRDAIGHVIMQITPDGTASFVEIKTKGFSADEAGTTTTKLDITSGGSIKASQGASQEVSDANGKCASQVDSSGHTLLSDAFIQRQFRGSWEKIPGVFDYEINHIIGYGQSWACGFDAVPALTTTQLYDTIMFNGGIRQQYSMAENPAALQSFVPAVESTNVGTPEFPTANVGETGLVAMSHLIKNLVEFENNILFNEQRYQILLSAPGEGSKTIEELSSEDNPYINRLYEQINRGFAIAQAQGKTYAVQAVTWMQGSNEVQGAGYAAQLEALRVKISDHAKTVTGQTKEVIMITWQLMPQSNLVTEQRSAKNVYERFVVAADTYPYIICSGPSYQVNMISGTNVHISPGGMIQLGESMGLSYKRSVIDGKLAESNPLRPTSLTRQGSVATLRLNVIDGKIVRDIERVAAITNDGFNLYNSSGTQLPISSVEILGTDRIKLVAASAIPSGAVLRYADTGVDFSETGKWRGNIRDSHYNSAGANRWLVAFSYNFEN